MNRDLRTRSKPVTVPSAAGMLDKVAQMFLGPTTYPPYPKIAKCETAGSTLLPPTVTPPFMRLDSTGSGMENHLISHSPVSATEPNSIIGFCSWCTSDAFNRHCPTCESVNSDCWSKFSYPDTNRFSFSGKSTIDSTSPLSSSKASSFYDKEGSSLLQDFLCAVTPSVCSPVSSHCIVTDCLIGKQPTMTTTSKMPQEIPQSACQTSNRVPNHMPSKCQKTQSREENSMKKDKQADSFPSTKVSSAILTSVVMGPVTDETVWPGASGTGGIPAGPTTNSVTESACSKGKTTQTKSGVRKACSEDSTQPAKRTCDCLSSDKICAIHVRVNAKRGLRNDKCRANQSLPNCRNDVFNPDCFKQNLSDSCVNLEVKFTANPVTPTPKSKKKKRPSAKKRHRQQQKRDVQVTPQQQQDKRKITKSEDKTKAPSPAIPIKPNAFKVTVFDISPQNSPESACKSPLWGSPDIGSPLRSRKLSFVIHASETESDFESSVDDGGESALEEDDLWESFTNQGLGNPFSFSFTCSITSAEAKEPTVVAESPPSEGCSLVREANQRWEGGYGDVQVPPKTRGAKVRFPDEVKSLRQVRLLRTWSFAHQAARKGPWEQLGRDTERFKKRCQDVETAIKHVFDPKHRQAIYDDLHSVC